MKWTYRRKKQMTIPIKKIQFILIALYIAVGSINASSLYKNEDLTKIILKNGDVVYTKIKKLYYWGFYVNSTEGLSYKVINKIETKSDDLVDSLNIFINNMEVINTDEFYILDFKTAKLPEYPKNKEPLFLNQDYVFSIHFIPEPIFEIQLQKTFSKYRFLTGQISCFGGYFNRKTATHEMLSFSTGIGLQKQYNSNYLTFLLNCAVQFDDLSALKSNKYLNEGYPIKRYRAYSEYFSINYKYNSPNNRYLIQLGTEIYFADKLKSQSNFITFSLGIGYKLNMNSKYSIHY